MERKMLAPRWSELAGPSRNQKPANPPWARGSPVPASRPDLVESACMWFGSQQGGSAKRARCERVQLSWQCWEEFWQLGPPAAESAATDILLAI